MTNGFKFQNSVCNGCHNLTILHLNISGITFITVKVFINVVLSMTLVKSQAIHLLKTSVIVDKYKMHIKNNIKLETKNVLIDGKNYKDL